jgi:hypothetical protein
LLDIIKSEENINKKAIGQLTSWGEYVTARVPTKGLKFFSQKQRLDGYQIQKT